MHLEEQQEMYRSHLRCRPMSQSELTLVKRPNFFGHAPDPGFSLCFHGQPEPSTSHLRVFQAVKSCPLSTSSAFSQKISNRWWQERKVSTLEIARVYCLTDRSNLYWLPLKYSKIGFIRGLSCKLAGEKTQRLTKNNLIILLLIYFNSFIF